MKPQHLLLGWLAGVALLLQGCQSISNQKPPVPSPIAANRCALQTEGTTFKRLVESARGKKLKLVRVIRQEQSFPTLATDQWLEIDDDGKATASDGCNLFTFEPDHSPRQTDGNPFFQQFKPFTTLMACPENKSEFPLMSVYRYQQCGDEYWLYYDKTAVEEPKIMVFAPSVETISPANQVSVGVQVGRAFGQLSEAPSVRVTITSAQPLITSTLPVTSMVATQGVSYQTIVEFANSNSMVQGYRVLVDQQEYLITNDDDGSSSGWYRRDDGGWHYLGLHPISAPGLPFVQMLWAGPYAQFLDPLPSITFQTSALGIEQLNGSMVERFQVDRLVTRVENQPQLVESTIIWIDATTWLPRKSERIYPEQTMIVQFEYDREITLSLPSPLTDELLSRAMPSLPAPLYYLSLEGDIWLIDNQSGQRSKQIDESCPILDFDVATAQEKLVYSTGIALYEYNLATSERQNKIEALPGSNCNAEPPIATVRYSTEGSQIAFLREGVNLIASGTDAPKTVSQLLRNVRWQIETNDVNAIRIYKEIHWSPDDRYMALYASVWETGGIEILDLATQQLRTVHSLRTPDLHLCCQWQWGTTSQIGFVADGGFYKSFDPGVYQIDIATTATTQLKSGQSDYALHLQKSAFTAHQATSGDLFAFVVVSDDLQSLENPHYRLNKIDLDGGEPLVLQHDAIPIAGEVLWAANGEGAAVMTTRLSAAEQPLNGTFVWIAKDGTIYDLRLHGSNLQWGSYQ